MILVALCSIAVQAQWTNPPTPSDAIPGRPTASYTAHIANTNNPHGITPAQIGVGVVVTLTEGNSNAVTVTGSTNIALVIKTNYVAGAGAGDMMESDWSPGIAYSSGRTETAYGAIALGPLVTNNAANIGNVSNRTASLESNLGGMSNAAIGWGVVSSAWWSVFTNIGGAGDGGGIGIQGGANIDVAQDGTNFTVAAPSVVATNNATYTATVAKAASALQDASAFLSITGGTFSSSAAWLVWPGGIYAAGELSYGPNIPGEEAFSLTAGGSLCRLSIADAFNDQQATTLGQVRTQAGTAATNTVNALAPAIAGQAATNVLAAAGVGAGCVQTNYLQAFLASNYPIQGAVGTVLSMSSATYNYGGFEWDTDRQLWKTAITGLYAVSACASAIHVPQGKRLQLQIRSVSGAVTNTIIGPSQYQAETGSNLVDTVTPVVYYEITNINDGIQLRSYSTSFHMLQAAGTTITIERKR